MCYYLGHKSNMYRMACCQMLSDDDSFIITVAKRCSVRFKYSVFGFSSFYFINRPLLQLLEASYLPKMMAPHCSVLEISGKHKHFQNTRIQFHLKSCLKPSQNLNFIKQLLIRNLNVCLKYQIRVVCHGEVVSCQQSWPSSQQSIWNL